MTPIRNVLNVGADSARTLSELAEALGVSRREVEQAVQEARLAGVPIVGGSNGIYLAQTPQEARAWARRQRSRAIHLMESAQGVERGADVMDVEPLTLGLAA